jgi:hypothetical protein
LYEEYPRCTHVSVARAVPSNTANVEETAKEVFIVMTVTKYPRNTQSEDKDSEKAGDKRENKPTQDIVAALL